MKNEDTQALRTQGAEPFQIKVNKPIRTAPTTVHHYNTVAQGQYSPSSGA